MAKDEKTSKRVASKAGRLMKEIDQAIASLSAAIMALKMARSVAASALTQAPDKKKR